MKKILFALSMLAFVVSAVPQGRGADVSIDFIYDNLSGGNWIDVEGYGYGWQPDVVVRDPNWRPYSDGYWAYTITGGPGSATRISVGPRITTVAGPISRTTVGSGFREKTWIGDRPGSHGELVAITLVGRLCRRAGRASFMKTSPSAGTWM